MSAEAKKPMMAFDLCEALERFASDNTHSRDLDDRFLAAQLDGILTIARQVRNNNLGTELRKEVNAFRAKEIETEMADKRRQLDVLERDYKKAKEAAA